MAQLFSQILNMSLTGSVVIAVVLAVRFFMRKLPKVFSYALWSVVLFRLLCPVSFSGPGSLLEFLDPQVQETAQSVTIISYLPEPEELPEFQYISAADQAAQASQSPSDSPSGDLMDILSWVWLTGAAAMALYGGAQLILLRRKLIGAVRIRRNIYLADHIDTAFVMGILRPRIYLPCHVPVPERKYILAHERNHIRRGDHITKLLAYSALCIHWFNPLVWIAFLLAGKDMEMSCDEAVIRRFGSQIRAEYSASLLRLAAHRKPVPGMPLAFGEGDTKGRIMNMAKWKQPKLWSSILCGLMCIAILAACALNPAQQNPASSDPAVLNDQEPVPDNPDTVQILLVILQDGEDAARVGDSTLVISLDRTENSVSLHSIPGDTVIDLPDYQNHVTGNEPFRVCYALGYVWGGQKVAMEMANQCVLESFGYRIDYNAEMTWEDVKNLIDSLGGISFVVEQQELVDFAESDNPILSDSSTRVVTMDGTTAVEYAYPQSDEGDSGVAERSRLRQRKLLAAVIAGIHEDPQILQHSMPDLFYGDTLSDSADSWATILGFMDNDTVFYLDGMAAAPAAAGADIVTNVELIQYGNLRMALPEGYSSHAEDNTVIISKDGIDVGGIRSYKAPDMPFRIGIDYLRAMGLPEAQETEEPIAYMIGSCAGGGMEAEFFHELQPETLNVEHHLYPDGDLVYDIYFDQNLLSDVQASKFLRTIEINREPMYPAQPEETDSLELCRNALAQIQSGSSQIRIERENQGEAILNHSSVTVYTAGETDWISITYVPDDNSYHGNMEIGGKHYSNEQTGWEESGAIKWQEDPYRDEVYVPWISGFQWDENLVTYIGTITDADGKTVKLRIDEPMRGYEDVTTCYFVDVHFTADGSFLNAEIEITYAQGMDVTYIEITESIMTLDANTINTYIEHEYDRAVGES